MVPTKEEQQGFRGRGVDKTVEIVAGYSCCLLKEEEKGMIWPSRNCEEELSLPSLCPPLFQVCANAARSSSLLQFPPSTVSGDRMRAPYPKSMRAFMRRPVNGARSTCAFGNLKIAFLGSGPPARFSIGRLSGTVEHRESPERERKGLA